MKTDLNVDSKARVIPEQVIYECGACPHFYQHEYEPDSGYCWHKDRALPDGEDMGIEDYNPADEPPPEWCGLKKLIEYRA